MTNNELNRLGGVILDACITVHKELGPGLLESAYVNALNRELELRNILVDIQVPVKLVYKECFLGKVYVIDMLIENEIVLEIKAVNAMEPVFTAS